LAKKVDRLKSFRNLDDRREELRLRFRKGFFNVSFLTEFIMNDDLNILVMDERKVYLT
jgi:hypothetical protein